MEAQGLNHWTAREVLEFLFLVNKETACNAEDTGDAGLIPGLRRSPGGGNGNPLQYSCLDNPKDRGAWWATVHRVSRSPNWVTKYGHMQKQPLSLRRLQGFISHSQYMSCRLIVTSYWLHYPLKLKDSLSGTLHVLWQRQSNMAEFWEEKFIPSTYLPFDVAWHQWSECTILPWRGWWVLCRIIKSTTVTWVESMYIFREPVLTVV